MFRCQDVDLLIPLPDDGFPTNSTIEQRKVEKDVRKCYYRYRRLILKDSKIYLNRGLHIGYLRSALFNTEKVYYHLESSRTWIAHWITHALVLLGDKDFLSLHTKKIIEFCKKFSNETGGYAGAPQQLSHLATTYAAINCLITLHDEEALKSINRRQLYSFLMSMKQQDGSFTIHRNGELDTRSAYCAVSVAYLCRIQTKELFEKTVEWLLKCQTYEGGFGACPGDEAHGGYTFCAFAALFLLGEAEKCNLKSLLRWTLMKQTTFEGGFVGRTNKIVDGCYSFWQGAVISLINSILLTREPNLLSPDRWLFNQQALQEYLLCCCQDRSGGMLDKPKKTKDYYHTCYDLSGLANAQFSPASQTVVGTEENLLIPVNPALNLDIEAVQFAINFFNQCDFSNDL